MKKIFLAVPLPRKVRKQLAQKIKEVRSQICNWQVGWVKPRNLHVTLIFLGWVEEKQIPKIKKEIAEAVEGEDGFALETGSLNSKGRSIWFEISKGTNEINRLYRKVSENLTLKEPEESRPFHTHLTIGRTKKRGLAKPTEAKNSLGWETDKIVLYESKFRKAGPVYEKLASFSLKK